MQSSGHRAVGISYISSVFSFKTVDPTSGNCKICLTVNVNFKCSFHSKWEKTTNVFHVGGHLELYSSSFLSSCSLTSGQPEGMAPWDVPVRGSQCSLKVTGGAEAWVLTFGK